MPSEQDITEINFRGCSAQVRIGDRPLVIYKPEYDYDTKTATGWIASEPGKEYSVCWKKDYVTDYSVSGHVCIDGPRARDLTLAWTTETDWMVVTGEPVRKDEEMPFIFSPIITTGWGFIILLQGPR